MRGFGLLSSAKITAWKQTHRFTLAIEGIEDGFYVEPGLRRGCHRQAKNLDTLMKRIREVIELCLQDENQSPSPLELIGIQQVGV